MSKVKIYFFCPIFFCLMIFFLGSMFSFVNPSIEQFPNMRVSELSQGSPSLTRVRGLVQTAEIELSFSKLRINRGTLTLEAFSLELREFDRLILNGTSIGYLDIDSTDIQDIVFNTSYPDPITFYPHEIANFSLTRQDSFAEGVLERGRFSSDNVGRNYLHFLSPDYVGNLDMHANIWIIFENATEPLHLTANATLPSFQFEIIGYAEMYFNGSFAFGFHDKGSMITGNNLYSKYDFLNLTWIKLVDSLGNFSVGPDSYQTFGYDELFLYNSFNDISGRNNIALNISRDESQAERQLSIKFGNQFYDAHITQLIINGQVQYSADLIIQQAPPMEVDFDESQRSSLELFFYIYNPTQYDLFDLEIILTNELGGLFDINLTLDGQAPVYLNFTYSGFLVNFIPASSGMACRFMTDLSSFGNLERRDGDILFIASNSEELTFSLSILHTSLYDELKALLTSPILLAIIPLFAGLGGNIYKNLLEIFSSKQLKWCVVIISFETFLVLIALFPIPSLARSLIPLSWNITSWNLLMIIIFFNFFLILLSIIFINYLVPKGPSSSRHEKDLTEREVGEEK